ncbi:hypothetical protein ccbrp13_21540 [Ktedonobacteria bacterium brp13]|nr:hypothetical protein ccbrp13_21540 [Ktedonobacteria bacterium brp13]
MVTDQGALLLHSSIEESDFILRVSTKNGAYDGVLPNVEKVVYFNRSSGLLNIEATKTYTKIVPFHVILDILQRPISAGAVEITHDEYTAIVTRMQELYISEQEFLTYLKQYILSRGYYFEEETLYNYHICLKTHPFVLLAGLSGTGKSKLAQLYAEAVGSTRENKRFLRLAVRPSWNDDRFLLGYLNTITGEYVTEPAIDFLLRAEKDRDHLYFFCLDEMNLSHVEYYFSQFLSALEEDKTTDRIIPLLSETVWNQLKATGKNITVPHSFAIPPNVFFTGTVNVDETTRSISDKVVDRANTIEFFTIDLAYMPPAIALPKPISLTSENWNSYVQKQSNTSYRTSIAEIGQILNKAHLGFGYRVLHDIEQYIANSQNILSAQVAFDLQVKQRVLPHIRGAAAITSMLDELIVFTQEHDLPRSQERIEEMKGRLSNDGYTSFWR